MEADRKYSRRHLIRIAALGLLTAGTVYLSEKDSENFGQPTPPIPLDEIINNPRAYEQFIFRTSGYLKYEKTKEFNESLSLNYFNVFSNPDHTGESISAILPLSGNPPQELFKALEEQGKVTFFASISEVSDYATQMGVYQLLITGVTEIQ